MRQQAGTPLARLVQLGLLSLLVSPLQTLPCSFQIPARSHATHLRPCTELQPHQRQAEYGLLTDVREIEAEGSAKRHKSLQSHYRISRLFCFRTLSATERIYMCGCIIQSVSLGHVTHYTMKGISNSLREQQPETKVRRSRGQPVPAMTSGQQPVVERAATGTKRTK